MKSQENLHKLDRLKEKSSPKCLASAKFFSILLDNALALNLYLQIFIKIPNYNNPIMTTPYQKYIAFILLTSMLLQSCNMDFPAAGQDHGGLNNTATQHEERTVLSEIQPLEGLSDAQDQGVQPEGRQASSHDQLRLQRTTATSIDSSDVTGASSRIRGQIKCKRLVIRRKDILQGGGLCEKDRDATESSVAKCVEDNIVVTWKEKAGKYEDTATCSIFNPSSCKMEPLSASRTAPSGEVAFPLDLSTTQSSILFEAEIKRKSLKASSSSPLWHAVGLSTFKNPGYSLEVYTNSELSYRIPKNDDNVRTQKIEKISEELIEALKNRATKVEETTVTQGQGSQVEETTVTQGQGSQVGETKETQEQGVQTEAIEVNQEEQEGQKNDRPRRLSRMLIYSIPGISICFIVGIKALKFFNSRKA